jgi:LacI family transcriptional regulator
MGVTIKDVAKKTGLSITTVSLVLNKKESRIPEKTRQIIKNAAEELKYAPNQAAVSLSTKRTNLIALVLPRKTCYFFADLASSMENACRSAGYGLIISLPDGDEAASLDAIREVLRRGVDGVVFDPSGFGGGFCEAYIALVQNSEIPVCSLAGVKARLLPNSIVPDHRQGGRLAALHLLDLEHTEIGFIGGPKENYIVSDMILGIEDAFEEHCLENGGLPTLIGDNTAAAGYDGLETLLKKKSSGGLTGIIAGSDNIAAGVLRRAHELGLSVPEQISVVGYGNSSSGAEYSPPLTTISIHCDRIARKAVRLLEKSSADNSVFTPELVQPSLIVRGSAAPVGR